MKGAILDFSTNSNSGVISGDDGKRYTFVGAEWKATGLPSTGQRVDFAPADESAQAIYADQPATGGKSKIAAGILAIILGWLGVHKFYLGFTTPGVIMLLCGTVGMLLFVPPIVVSVIGLVEGILYLTKSDAEFHKAYEVDRKQWF